MLISTQKKFCYIANTKTASTSIENILKKISEIHFGGTPALKHMSLEDLEFKIAPLLAKKKLNIDDYYKFSVIREPVSWVVSWFNYHSLPNFKNKDVYLGDLQFDVFLDKVLTREILYVSRGQSTRFHSECYKMDELICYENLSNKFDQLAERFSFDFALPYLNVTTQQRIHLDDVNDTQKSKINIYFSKDVSLYNKWLELN